MPRSVYVHGTPHPLPALALVSAVWQPLDGWIPLQGSQESEGFPSLHLKAEIKPFCTTPKTDHKALKYRDGALTHWAAGGAWMLDSDVVLSILLSLAAYFPSHPLESARCGAAPL